MIALATVSFAQTPTTDWKKLPSLGFNFFLKDFGTAEQIRKTSVSDVLSNKTYSKIGDMAPGIGLQYMQGLSNNVDFMANLGGSFTKYKRTDTGRAYFNNGDR